MRLYAGLRSVPVLTLFNLTYSGNVEMDKNRQVPGNIIEWQSEYIFIDCITLLICMCTFYEFQIF